MRPSPEWYDEVARGGRLARGDASAGHRYGESGVAVDTGTRPPLPGFALSSATPVTSNTMTTAPTATSRMRIRVVVVRTGTVT